MLLYRFTLLTVGDSGIYKHYYLPHLFYYILNFILAFVIFLLCGLSKFLLTNI